jgi:hypothetical protein
MFVVVLERAATSSWYRITTVAVLDGMKSVAVSD